MLRVIFEYDEKARKWSPVVEGAEDNVEARQAFSAVVITCRELRPALLVHTQVSVLSENRHLIVPAV